MARNQIQFKYDGGTQFIGKDMKRFLDGYGCCSEVINQVRQLLDLCHVVFIFIELG